MEAPSCRCFQRQSHLFLWVVHSLNSERHLRPRKRDHAVVQHAMAAIGLADLAVAIEPSDRGRRTSSDANTALNWQLSYTFSILPWRCSVSSTSWPAMTTSASSPSRIKSARTSSVARLSSCRLFQSHSLTRADVDALPRFTFQDRPHVRC